MKIKDFFTFRRMFTPILIKGVFWLGLIFCWTISIVSFFQANILAGLAILVFGTIAIRIFCESLILFFQVNNTLADILRAVKGKHSLNN